MWFSRPRAKTAAEAFSFLADNGLSTALFDKLWPILRRLWQDAWDAGQEAAESLSGPGNGVDGGPGHFPESEGRRWVNQIIHNRLEDLADLFAEAIDADELAEEVRALLSSETRAELIAVTEVTRAMQYAAMQHYRRTGIHLVLWLTEEDARVCPACRSNEAAAAHPLGVPFPSGAVAPPDHPRCRCALIPA